MPFIKSLVLGDIDYIDRMVEVKDKEITQHMTMKFNKTFGFSM